MSQKMELADESPEAFTIKTGTDKTMRSIDNYMLSELVKTQKGYNSLLDVIEEYKTKFSSLDAAIKGLADSGEKRHEILEEGKAVTLTLHGNTIKASAFMAGGSIVERPISNFLHNAYTPLSSGTYGVLFGLVAMGLTYKSQGDWKQWLAQGYFIGGFSQMVQDLMQFLATQPGLGALGGLSQ